MLSLAVRLFHPHDPQLRTGTFSFSELFKRAAIFGGPLLSEPFIGGRGRYFLNYTVMNCLTP